MPKRPAHFHLCPSCFRVTPASAKERYCLNDGSELLQGCPHCKAAITSPYARYCQHCGTRFAGETSATEETHPKTNSGTPKEKP